MNTVIEHDINTDGSMSTALTAIVAIIAVVLVAGIALYMLRMYPFNDLAAANTTDATPSVNVNINSSLPGANPITPGY